MVVLFFTMRVEDGNLFDSSYEDVNKAYGTFDENRAAQNGYQAFPFQAGKKTTV
jgi:FKBP-type peptidyl-prolyl cis-trans isomerase 2